MFDFNNFIYSEKSPLLFTQSAFWVFFFVVYLIHNILYKENKLKNIFLTIFSFYFYYLSSGFYVILLLISTLIDFYIGKKIYLTDEPKKRKELMILSLVSNLTLLGFFKYTYFFTDIFNQIFKKNIEVFNPINYFLNLIFNSDYNVNEIILPVGISFYTFQTISYTVDIYRNKLKPVDSLWDFAFFVSFFPQLVAGPIVRASEFIPQIFQKFELRKEEFSKAYFLILTGLVKKIFLSDYISVNIVDRVFESPSEYTGIENLMGVYGYALQIYCDFSGYTDIAIGISLLLGFKLPLNFNSPYKAENITDFWRRWHISLSSWLRDYLYIPLGGNRNGVFNTYKNLIITMLLGGLWHGAHLRFIIWGALHGVALSFHKFYSEKLQNSYFYKKTPKWISIIITFNFVCFCWIFFRSESMEIAFSVIEQIVFNFRLDLIVDILITRKLVIMVLLIGFLMHFMPYNLKNKLLESFSKLPDFTKATITLILIIFLYQVKSSDLQPFIYFQF
ncbi:MAG: MBOAT family protein [Flammeovirgaceae bacterium]